MRPSLAPDSLRRLIRFCSPHTQELVDYFFYALLRTQGEDTTDERSTTGVVPIAEVPNIMRALGFYPTEQVIFARRMLHTAAGDTVENKLSRGAY